MDPTTFEQVQAAIEAGQPGTFATSADGYGAVLTTLTALSSELPQAVTGVIGAGGSWGGEAATAFGQVAADLMTFLGDTITPLQPYGPALTTAGQALTTAKTEIEAYAQQVAAMRQAAQAAGTAPDEAAINAGALAILAKLVSAYQTAGSALTPVPENPSRVGAAAGDPQGSGPGTDPQNDPQNDPANDPGDGPGNGPGNVPGGPVSLLTSAPLIPGGTGDFSTSSASIDFATVPSFAHTPGGDSTVLTGFTGTLQAPPVFTPAPANLATTPGGGEIPFFGVFGGGGPGSFANSVRRNGFGADPSVLTSVGRLPGLGSEGYTQPPAATPAAGIGETPATWSRFGAGAGGLDRDGRRERKTSLLGDEDWTDPDGVDGAIGRPAPAGE